MHEEHFIRYQLQAWRSLETVRLCVTNLMYSKPAIVEIYAHKGSLNCITATL